MTNRIILGKNPNNDLGTGFFVSNPGMNVLDAAQAHSGNLMFDTSGSPAGSIRVIQEGQFALTCTRKEIPATFPSGINFIEEAGITIDIPEEHQDGTIPEVMVWYAVGNSSGHFHPWYTEVAFNTATGCNGYAEGDITSYTNQQELRHMDSAQFRGKYKAHPHSNFDHGTYLPKVGFDDEADKILYSLFSDNRISNPWSNSFFLNSDSTGKVLYEYDQYTSNNGNGPSVCLKPERTYDPAGERGVVVGDDALVSPNTHPHDIFSQNEGMVGVVYFTTPKKLIVNAFMSACHSSADAPDPNLLHLNEEIYRGHAHRDGTWIRIPYNRHSANAMGHANLVPGTSTTVDGGWQLGDFVDLTSQWRRPLSPSTGSESFFNPYANNYIQHNYNYPDNYNWFKLYNNYYWLDDWRNTSTYANGFSEDARWEGVGNTGYDHWLGALGLTPTAYPMEQDKTSGNYDIISDTANGLYDVYKHRIDRGLLNLYGADHAQSLSSYPDRVDGGSLNPDWKSHGSKPWNQDPEKMAAMMFYYDDFLPGPTSTPHTDDYVWDWTPANPYDLTQYGPGGVHGFGPALGGAGSVESLNGSHGWDTYYCKYIIYKKGGGTMAENVISEQAPNTYTFTIKDNPTVNGWGDVYSQSKFRQDAKFVDDRYFNLEFPDDFVGTVGDAATDQFHDRRSASGKIYGNIHINLMIESGAEIGSEDYSRVTESPMPAIQFDLSGNTFEYDGNPTIALTIINEGQIVGGGGAGGFGVHAGLNGGTSDGTGLTLKGGGGGGAGGGSGGGFIDRSAWHPLEMIYSYGGVGVYGWGSGTGTTLAATYRGSNGAAATDWSGDFSTEPAQGGAMAATGYQYNSALHNTPYPWWTLTTGGDGGNTFNMKCDLSVQPRVEIINRGTGRIRSGGGGGGGGVTQYGTDTHSAAGGPGGNTGHDAALGGTLPAASDGGFAGYLMGSSDASYMDQATVRNEVAAQATPELTYSYSIQARNPDGVTRGTPGWSSDPQETKRYE